MKNTTHFVNKQRLADFESVKEYQAFLDALDYGALPSGETLPGGLTQNQVVQRVKADLKAISPVQERSDLDKTGRLNKVVKGSDKSPSESGKPFLESLCTDSKYSDSKKYCSCPSCRNERTDIEDNRSSVYDNESLQKKAVAKLVSQKLATALARLDSPLRKSYNRTINCANYQYVQDGKIYTEYCKCRWCLVCNRNRTAELIQDYIPIINSWDDKYLVTLTVPNVDGFHLADTIETMHDFFDSIKRKIWNGRKRTTYEKDSQGNYITNADGERVIKEAPFNGFKFQALRKIECTYNLERSDYHPHYHILVDSKKAAYKLVELWVQDYPGAERVAQDVRPCSDDLGDLKELFKYFTKIFSSVKDATGEKIYSAHVDKLDVIFQAIEGKRTLQPYGFTKKDYQDEIENFAISEHILDDLSESEIEEITAFEPEKYDSEYIPPDGVYRWSDSFTREITKSGKVLTNFESAGWHEWRTGEPLCNFKPSKSLLNLVNNIYIYGVNAWDVVESAQEIKDLKKPWHYLTPGELYALKHSLKNKPRNNLTKS